MDAPNRSSGLTDVVQDLIDNVTLLFRQEVALFKAEVSQTVSQLSRDAVLVVVGGVVAFTGVLALVAAAILGLALVWPAWAAALSVGGLITLIGVLLLMRGIKAVQKVSAAPERTVRSVGSTVAMIKEKV